MGWSWRWRSLFFNWSGEEGKGIAGSAASTCSERWHLFVDSHLPYGHATPLGLACRVSGLGHKHVGPGRKQAGPESRDSAQKQQLFHRGFSDRSTLYFHQAPGDPGLRQKGCCPDDIKCGEPKCLVGHAPFPSVFTCQDTTKVRPWQPGGHPSPLCVGPNTRKHNQASRILTLPLPTPSPN